MMRELMQEFIQRNVRKVDEIEAESFNMFLWLIGKHMKVNILIQAVLVAQSADL